MDIWMDGLRCGLVMDKGSFSYNPYSKEMILRIEDAVMPLMLIPLFSMLDADKRSAFSLR